MRWALTEKVDTSLPFLSISATADVVKWEPHSYRVSAHNTITRKHGNRGRNNVRTKSNNMLLCLLSIEGQMGLALEQDSSLIDPATHV